MEPSLPDQESNTIIERLNGCDFGIWYHPLKDEIDPDSLPFVSVLRSVPILWTSQDRHTSPESVAQRITNDHPNQCGYLLIPGQRFDWTGTRQGRGGGWYDRFLAALPNDFPRIGVTDRTRISDRPLIRNSWDEPMNWLIYRENGQWYIKQTEASFQYSQKKSGEKDDPRQNQNPCF